MQKKVNKSVVSSKPVVSAPPPSAADLMWEEIQNLRIDMFALPNQFIKDYCKQIKVEPTRLYLQMSVSSVLPSLEAAIAPKYSVERTDKYAVIALTQK
jgi:hypothetical protein